MTPSHKAIPFAEERLFVHLYKYGEVNTMRHDPYRTWRKPSAKRRYERDRTRADNSHQAQVDKVCGVIEDTIGRYKTIVAYGEHNLLLTLANIIGFRLYDEETDTQRTGASKYRQGERQRIMKDAVRQVIDSNVAELHIDQDSERLQLRIPRRPVAAQPPNWTLVINGKQIHNYIPSDEELETSGIYFDDSDHDIEYPLSDCHLSMLRRLKEPIFT